MAITYKLSWLFLRFLERGEVSELGLAQSEDSFPATNSRQKDCDLPSRLFIGNGVSISRQEEDSGRQEKSSGTWSATRDFGTLYYEDRKPFYCSTESHRTVSSGLFLGFLEARFEWNVVRMAPT
jgi:hypothetical protein